MELVAENFLILLKFLFEKTVIANYPGY
ncbi:uncharacterized protein METZ01_LOCUS236981 [marine metagenome]|uniref:Uncharacterized protein n=1 Tax=marine metagenome TaxID=408172 RepID=A0A382HB37_9ZZZZ